MQVENERVDNWQSGGKGQGRRVESGVDNETRDRGGQEPITQRPLPDHNNHILDHLLWCYSNSREMLYIIGETSEYGTVISPATWVSGSHEVLQTTSEP